MLKRILAVLLIALMLLTFCACGKVTLHCDGCGKELKGTKEMTEEWIILCADCEKEINAMVEPE